MKKQLTVGEVAKRGDVKISTLHFYEAKGLISSSRTSGNQRLYARDVLRRIAVIKAGKAVGLSLTQIKAAFANLPADRAPTTRDWQKLALSWQDRLNAQIENLQQLRDKLTWCIGCGCLSLKKCKIYNKDDALSKQNAGAALLRLK